VETIRDDWGPGTCHDRGGVRTLRLTNTGTVTRYSNLAAFTDDTPVCATSKTPTGQPRHWGCTEIKPGETCDFSIEVTFPKGTDGVCALQVDDCWGPGGIRECAFVVGDVFKVPDSLCSKVCVEDPTVTTKTECGDWSSCTEADDGCQRVQTCVETTTTDFICKPDTRTTRTWENTEPCTCECVEGGPYGPKDTGDPTWDPTILEGACPDQPTASDQCRSSLDGDVRLSCRPTPQCHQLGIQTTTTTWDCQDPTFGERQLCRPVDCPQTECVLPPDGATLQNLTNPRVECDAFEQFTGEDYEPTLSDPDFWICKAGRDHIVSHTPTGSTCPNGKDRSHETMCRCVEAED
jgi:hypothetical protein